MKGIIRGCGVLAVVCGIYGLALYGQSRADVDYKAEDSFDVPVADSLGRALVGNVLLYHNGAILSCDSAVMYNRDYFEFFSRVIVNKDSTYIYGERADIDNITNLAKVYSLIVKTVDRDMTMYSSTMEFNTLTKIGRFTGGGTISQKDNLIEALEGIYHVDERDIYFSGQVAMRNEEYLLQTDSMSYNFDTEISRFYRPAKIWNKDGDFLSANRGYYDRGKDLYFFEENSYILTDNQEIFADSMLYLKTEGVVCLFGNIQVHDREQKSFAWGGFGIYWLDNQQGILTENPSAMTYDDQAEKPDSIYMRGDTMMMHSFSSELEFDDKIASLLRLPRRDQLLDSLWFFTRSQVALRPRPDSMLADSLSSWGHLYGEGADSALREYGMRGMADSLSMDSLSLDSALMDIDSVLVDSLRADSVSVKAEKKVVVEKPKTKRELRKERRLERQRLALEKRKAKMREYAIREGILQLPDSTALADSLLTDSLPALDSLSLMQVDTIARDSLQRVFRAFRNVRIYRSDLQAVCDSLAAYSIDSTAHMYGHPVLWNDQNQIVSQIARFYGRNGQLDRAEFEEDPIMVQWVIDSLFNQATGERMEAFFENNDLRRLELLKSPHAYYYSQEDNKPGEIGMFADIKAEEKGIFMFNDSMKLEFIRFYPNVESVYYPMHKIPESDSQRLPNFEWLPHLRPKSRWDVCDRIEIPSKREETELIPYPSFPLTERIEADKKRYIGQKIWFDRKETISVDPSSFLR